MANLNYEYAGFTQARIELNNGELLPLVILEITGPEPAVGDNLIIPNSFQAQARSDLQQFATIVSATIGNDFSTVPILQGYQEMIDGYNVGYQVRSGDPRNFRVRFYYGEGAYFDGYTPYSSLTGVQCLINPFIIIRFNGSEKWTVLPSASTSSLSTWFCSSKAADQHNYESISVISGIGYSTGPNNFNSPTNTNDVNVRIPVIIDGFPESIKIGARDPYDDAGEAGPGDYPHGTFDYTSDGVGNGRGFTPPSISAVDTGFVTLYNPTLAQLKSLSDYLWSSSFDINALKKLFNDPMDLFIGLSILPVSVPNGATKEVGIGLISSGVFMDTAATQWVMVDCGVCQIDNFSEGYLDYSPYTKVEVYLPYIGFRTLNADEVIGKTLSCVYWVDILTGSCTCWLDVLMPLNEANPQDNEYNTTYVFMGECAVSIPLASGDWTNLINGIIGAAAAVGAGFAAGGAGGAIAGGVSAASSVAVNDSKIQVERSGAITSSGGLLGPQEPFVVISTPRIHRPAEAPTFTGYPAYFTATLDNLSGFTIVDKINLSGISATKQELEEIETLLKGGVIL